MKNKVLIIGMLLLLISCKHEIKKYYYDNGCISKEVEIIDKNKTYVRYYYENSQIQMEGLYCDSLREGMWKLYYRDGVLDTDAFFYKGKVLNIDKIISEKKYTVSLDFKGNPQIIKKGNTYKFRLLVSGLWYNYDICSYIKLGLIETTLDDSIYPLKIRVRNVGTHFLVFHIKDSNENIKDSILFKVNVVE